MMCTIPICCRCSTNQLSLSTMGQFRNLKLLVLALQAKTLIFPVVCITVGTDMLTFPLFASIDFDLNQ